jgi:asparaginyl-tRNA synthetase
LRHHLAFAVHQFFNERGFFYLHSPIITGSDAEGAGEMFKVTTLDLNNLPKDENGQIDHGQDFFGKSSNLTVSGQLEAELAALALGKVYTFGPTFRAENSNTSRHLAEFWMIEPEVAFNDIVDNMDLAEEFLKYCLKYVLDNAIDDLTFLQDREAQEDKTKPMDERQTMPLIDRLKFVVENPFERITYTEAIDILMNSNHYKKKKFKYDVSWGIDLQSEHERYLVEKHFQKPVIITGYPAAIKAFYMRMNEDGKTVAAMDILVPGIGEIIGGSQREERYDILKEKCAQFNIPEDHIWWYLETRKFGTCPHAGFGLGFERMVMYATGMSNIRDVIPFPRTPLNAEF